MATLIIMTSFVTGHRSILLVTKLQLPEDIWLSGRVTKVFFNYKQMLLFFFLFFFGYDKLYD